MRIVVLGSGSSGNCTYVEGGGTRLLLDAGFGVRSLARRFAECGLSLPCVDGILLTHGHTDHVAAAASLARRFQCVVYLNEGTRQEVLSLRGYERVELFRSNQAFQVGSLEVHPFSIPHDSADPVGFRIEGEGIRGVFATDLGEIPDTVQLHAGGCDWMVLEANHDTELLKMGPYPWDLKRRVLGARGHLSNEDLACFLGQRFDGVASHLFLAHLSRQNNIPELALASAEKALRSNAHFNGTDLTRVHLTAQNNPSIVVTL